MDVDLVAGVGVLLDCFDELGFEVLLDDFDLLLSSFDFVPKMSSRKRFRKRPLPNCCAGSSLANRKMANSGTMKRAGWTLKSRMSVLVCNQIRLKGDLA